MRDPAFHKPNRLQGQLLIADPSVHDETFYKSVIVISAHSKKRGATGLILNHPSTISVGELVEDEELRPLWHLPVHIGGPVDRDKLIFAALSWNKKFSIETRLSPEEAISYLQDPNCVVCAYAGHSSWTQGQLENELKHSTWIVTPPSAELANSSFEPSLWKKTLSSISPFHRILAETPRDVFLN